MSKGGILKLRAHDADDLGVISAVLQDALVSPRNITYLQREKRFVMVVNRFRWECGAAPAEEVEGDAPFEENADAGGPVYERVNCGLCFDRVRAVRSRGLTPRERNRFHNLLAINAAPGAITLVFSGGGSIRLEGHGICCHLEDLGEPWPTQWRPEHALDDAAGKA